MLVKESALLFSVLTGIFIVFQGFLAAGMPWGKASMGGKYPGKYPPRMRVIALVNMLLLAALIIIVLARAGLFLPQLQPVARVAIWIIVVFFGIGTVLNTITPSKIERIWAPVALLQLITCLIVAIN